MKGQGSGSDYFDTMGPPGEIRRGRRRKTVQTCGRAYLAPGTARIYLAKPLSRWCGAGRRGG